MLAWRELRQLMERDFESEQTDDTPPERTVIERSRLKTSHSSGVKKAHDFVGQLRTGAGDICIGVNVPVALLVLPAGTKCEASGSRVVLRSEQLKHHAA
jgi:hypothetical protein